MRWMMAFVAAAVSLALAGWAPAAEQPPQRQAWMKMVKEAQATHPQLSVAEAKKLIASEKKLVVVDVREAEELAKGKVAGSVHIPRGLLEPRIAGKAPDLNQPILLYCGTGARGAMAGEQLKKMGYTNVKNVTGGFGAWAKEEKK